MEEIKRTEILMIQVCMGSSCYLRGSGEIVNEMKRLLEEHGISSLVCLKGNFCMEKCTTGVTLKIGDQLFTGVHRQDIQEIFRVHVLSRLAGSSR